MKKYFILAAAAAMFAACSNNDDIAQGETPTERIPLTISAADALNAPAITMRGNNNAIQATTLDPTSTITTGIFIVKKNAKTVSSPTKESWEQWNIASTGYTANVTIGTNTDITTAALYYPDQKDQSIDIYAYAPKQSTTYSGTDISSNKVTVSIQANQNTKANYLLSDVLWGCVGEGTNGGTETKTGNKSNATISAENYLASKTSAQDGFVNPTGEIIIPMFHKASKIIIKITPSGMDLSKLKGATVKFLVQGSDASTPKLSTTLKVSDGTIDDVTAEATEVLAPITLTEHLGQSEDGSADLDNTIADANGTQGVIGVANTSMTGYACSGIILPQTISKGQNLIEITLSDGTTKYAYVIPAGGSNVTFAAEKVYTYTITLKASGLELTTTVADWVDDTTSLPSSGVGDAELQ